MYHISITNKVIGNMFTQSKNQKHGMKNIFWIWYISKWTCIFAWIKINLKCLSKHIHTFLFFIQFWQLLKISKKLYLIYNLNSGKMSEFNLTKNYNCRLHLIQLMFNRQKWILARIFVFMWFCLKKSFISEVYGALWSEKDKPWIWYCKGFIFQYYVK